MKYTKDLMDYSQCKTVIVNDIDAPIYWMDAAEDAINGHPTFGPDKYSVTEVLKSVKQIVEKRRLLYEGKLTTTLSGSVPLWEGTIHHQHLEQYMEKYKDRYLHEVRIEMTRDGVTLSGAFDAYDIIDNILSDHKFAKEYTFTLNASGESDEWFKQLCMYVELIEYRFGKRPRKMRIQCPIKDWSSYKAMYTKGYPQKRIGQIVWDAPSKEFTSHILDEAFRKAKMSQKILEEDLIPEDCSPKDCYCTIEYAVMKDGAKRASKCFGTENEAREYRASLGEDYRIIHRISDARQCKEFCACREICEQGRRMSSMGRIEEDITDMMPF